MSDIVETLDFVVSGCSETDCGHCSMLSEAAATIRTLQEQVKKARNDALEEAANVLDKQDRKWKKIHPGIADQARQNAAAIRSLKANGESE